MISGHATPEGTSAYAARHDGLGFNRLPGLDWRVSPAGFGTYRVSDQVAAHQTALRQALLSGINLIDTSANYTDGESESVIGTVMDELIDAGPLARNEIVVVSKAGYIQGENYQISQERRRQGRPFPDVVQYAQGLEHCIHPEFLEDQLTRSLERLGLETVDVYLLHNPEYFLSWAHRAGIDVSEARVEYRRRLRLAFEHLEEEVSAGRIGAYGISSNTFPGSPDDPDFTSLSMAWETAHDAADAPAFHLIQLPFNLLEPEAATRENQPAGKTVLDFAAGRELGVLVNRPLNAIVGNMLIRLADMAEVEAPRGAQVAERVGALVSTEMELLEEILPSLELSDEERQGVGELLNAGRVLQERWAGFGSWHNWREVQERFLIPRVQHGVQFLSGQAGENERLRESLNAYVDRVNESLAAVAHHYQAAAARRAREIQEQVAEAEPAWAAPTLSQSAIRALRSTRGVTSVLVGMRDVRYVADVVAELYRPVEHATRRSAWTQLAQLDLT